MASSARSSRSREDEAARLAEIEDDCAGEAPDLRDVMERNELRAPAGAGRSGAAARSGAGHAHRAKSCRRAQELQAASRTSKGQKAKSDIVYRYAGGQEPVVIAQEGRLDRATRRSPAMEPAIETALWTTSTPMLR